jgi:hypothetical protein
MIPDKLFINLKILSKIQKNGRICRSSDGIIALENENFYQSIKRFITSDSRRQSVFEINSIINETIECMNNIVNSKFMNKIYSNTDEYYKHCETLSLLLRELCAAKNGIEHLKFTYSSDPNVNSQLDILVIKINSSIKDMQHKVSYFQSFLPELYKHEVQTHTINPNYYMTETTQLHSSSNLPPQSPNSYTEQIIETNMNELHYMNNINNISNTSNTSNMSDELNNIIDMNNMDSVI